jgi:hypothetical protein
VCLGYEDVRLNNCSEVTVCQEGRWESGLDVWGAGSGTPRREGLRR